MESHTSTNRAFERRITEATPSGNAGAESQGLVASDAGRRRGRGPIPCRGHARGAPASGLFDRAGGGIQRRPGAVLGFIHNLEVAMLDGLP